MNSACLPSDSAASLMRGSLVERVRRCGHPNCACAHDLSGRHGKSLTVELGGRTHSLHVRPEVESRVQAALAASAKLCDLANELTALSSPTPSTDCWPEGLMRRWYFTAVNLAINPHQVLVTPELVQILTGVARNFITQIEFSAVQ
jgi:hypothetical protein